MLTREQKLKGLINCAKYVFSLRGLRILKLKDINDEKA